MHNLKQNTNANICALIHINWSHVAAQSAWLWRERSQSVSETSTYNTVHTGNSGYSPHIHHCRPAGLWTANFGSLGFAKDYWASRLCYHRACFFLFVCLFFCPSHSGLVPLMLTEWLGRYTGVIKWTLSNNEGGYMGAKTGMVDATSFLLS